MTFDNIFAQSFVQNLGWALVHSLWQGALVALALRCALAALRDHTAGARHAAGALALALMVAAPVVTFFSLNADARGASAPALATAAASTAGGATASRQDDAPDYAMPSRVGVGAGAAVMGAPLLGAWAGQNFAAVLQWLVALWVAGAFVQAVRLFGGWRVAQRLRRQGIRPVAPAWEESLARLRRQLGVRRAVQMFESALVEVPTVVGWLKPVVLVPASAFAGLTPQQLEAVIAHELAHVRRHDYLVNLLQTLVEMLLFYHPAVWWVSRQVRIEREHACDDAAVAATRGGALAYARALAELEQLRSAVRPASLAVAADGGSLVARVRRLASRRTHARRPRRFATPLAAGLMLSAVLAACAAAAGSVPAMAELGGGEGDLQSPPARGRRVALTFVAFPSFRPAQASAESVDQMTRKVLADLAARKVRAVGFVGEGQLGGGNERRREANVEALRRWLDAGHELGNQGYRHLNLSNTPLEEWKRNVEAGESLLNRLLSERGRKLRYFSYPYLNTGADAESKRAAAEWLKGRGYAPHSVTIDSMDWLFAREHQEALRRGDAEGARRIAADYVPYMERMMEFYENLSREVFGREVPQVLMLTTSPVVADQMDEMLSMLERRGYRFVTLDEAVRDEAYTQPETYAGDWGVSWLQRWAFTKFGSFREEPHLPPSMWQFSKGEGVPTAERKK
jgi:beta-lactamase regulating signal transducer with metallopeptidase domain/peptidoglycan/xylan/chitin deacetylase (PgdA/CDA1 family)